MSVYSLKSPLSSAVFTIYAPGTGTLSYSLISSGENSAFAHFAAAIANHYNFSFLVPPGTHHCWVDRGGMIWEACPTPLHMTGHVLPLCENCGRTTLPCLQYPTSSVVYAMSTKVAPHEMSPSLQGTERRALVWQPSSLTTGPQPSLYCEIAKWSHLLCCHLEVKSRVSWLRVAVQIWTWLSMIFLVQVQLRSEVLHTRSSTQPGFEPITFRSWQCTSCLRWPSWRKFSQKVLQTNGNAVRKSTDWLVVVPASHSSKSRGQFAVPICLQHCLGDVTSHWGSLHEWPKAIVSFHLYYPEI